MPEGRALIDRAASELLDTEVMLLGGLGQQDRSALAGLLARLAALLERTHCTAAGSA